MKNSGQIQSLRAQWGNKCEPLSWANRDFWQQLGTGQLSCSVFPLGLRLYGLTLNLHSSPFQGKIHVWWGLKLIHYEVPSLRKRR